MPKPIALFAACILALAGANLFQVWGVLATFIFSEQLPTITTFRVVFAIWLPTALGAAWCGLRGGYLLVQRGDLQNWRLTVFAVVSCFVLKASGYELGFSSVRLAVTAGVGELHPGVNFLGFAMIAWLRTLRSQGNQTVRQPAAPIAPTTDGAA